MLIDDFSSSDGNSNFGKSWRGFSDQVMGGVSVATVTPEWERIEPSFSHFVAHRLEAPLDTSQLRRIGFVAIGRAFSAGLLVREVSFLG